MPEDVPVQRSSEYAPKEWSIMWNRNEKASWLEQQIEETRDQNEKGIPVRAHDPKVLYGRVRDPPTHGTASYMIDLPRYNEDDGRGDGNPSIVDVNPLLFSIIPTTILAMYLWWRANRKPYNTIDPKECTRADHIDTIKKATEATP